MKDLTERIAQSYDPFKALLFYKNKEDDYYVESYDMGKDGRAINAHPLNLSECQKLVNALDNSEMLKANYLRGNGLFPENLLFLDSERSGFAVWHTPAKKANLFFRANLEIPDGTAGVPPLVWKANREGLEVWALKSTDRPTVDSALYYAPFFNIYETGAVCMGNVKRQIPTDCSLFEFMSLWETFFFNSTFSHTLMQGAVKGDKIVSVWKRQMKGDSPYPLETLVKSNFTLKHLLR